MEGIKFMSDIW